MNWLKNDKYDVGFNIGKTDALKGKPRNLLSAKEGFKSMFSINSDFHMDSYIKGYKEGYRIGLILKATNIKEDNKTIDRNVSTSQEKININKYKSNSMNRQDYQIQEQQLTELAHFLDSFKNDIQERMQNYQIQVENMYENGLPVQVYNKFQNEHINITEAFVKSIVNKIESESIPYINANIERTRENIDFNQ